tara:strand:+ start:1974 stop:4118 length:2145 start_codon:yes stop_codon:yes gene_type:complete
MSRRRYFSGRETELKLGVAGYTGTGVALEVTEGRVGLGTTTAYHQLTINGDMQLQNELYGFDGKSGNDGESLISTGSSVFWGQPVVQFAGITVEEEGVTVGGLSSIKTLNFVGQSILATADGTGGIATITVDDFTPSGENTNVQFNDNGVFGGAETLVFNKLLNKVGVGSTAFGDETLFVTGNVGITSELNVDKVFVTDKTPILPNELASKEYVDLFATASLVVQQAVAVASTTNVNATYSNGSTAGIGNSTLGVGAKLTGNVNGELILDGYKVLDDDRILIKNQTNEAHNGYYVAISTGSPSAPFIIERAQDFDQPDEIIEGAFSFVTNGSQNGANGFVLIKIDPKFTTDGTSFVGFSTIRFTQFSAAGQVEAGDGLFKEGSVINVGTADTTRIIVNPDDIDLAIVVTSSTFNDTQNEKFFVNDIITDGYGRVTGFTTDRHKFATFNDVGVVKLDFNAFNTDPATGIITAANYFNVRNINLPFQNDSDAGIITARLIKGASVDTSGDILAIRHGNFSGIVTASNFVGDGSQLTGLISGIAIQKDDANVVTEGTILNFEGTAVASVVSESSGSKATVTINATDINAIGSANQVLFKNASNQVTTSSNLQFNGTNLTCAGTVTANSDEKLKKNVETITDALDKTTSLRGVEFDHKKTGDHCLGLIAQEVEKVIPDVVYEDSEGTKSIAYQNIVALLIEAVKDQQQQIDELKKRLN